MSRTDVVNLLYIVGFALFISGLRMVRGPRTAVRGNLVAAAGMAIALIGTLLDPRIGDWGLIVVGVVIGTAVGIPAARNVKMTAMPQMVALFNGVGGGAAALIAASEFHRLTPPRVMQAPLMIASSKSRLTAPSSPVMSSSRLETLRA